MIYRSGHNNWFEVELNVLELPKQSTFEVRFQHTAPPKELDFQSAADFTVQLIAEKYSNLFLGLSGGLDSEFVAEVLYRNKIPFTPIIGFEFSYRDQYFALEWCRKRNIKPVTFNFVDVQKEFFESGLPFVRQYHVLGEGITLTNYLSKVAQQHQGHLLVGEPSLPLCTASFDEAITDTFSMDYWQFGAEFNGILPGAFFSYTPEILLAQARELDCTINDSSARADLYNISYRPKIDIYKEYNVTDKTVKNAFGYFFNFDKYSAPKHCTWTREQLIQLLKHPGKY